MNGKPRHVEIRERLDIYKSGKFKPGKFYGREEIIADLEWLLAEHKRLRRERALARLSALPDPTPLGR